jgi:hypothetical protein
VVGAAFGVLLLLNNLSKTFGRVEKIGFLELLLAYLTIIMLLVAIIVNNLDAFALASAPITGELPGGIAFSIPVAPPDPQIEFLTLIGAGVLAAFSLFIILLEVFRPQRLKASRGVFGLFSAGFLALATVGVPFVGVYLALDPDPPLDDDAMVVVDAPTDLTSPPTETPPRDPAAQTPTPLRPTPTRDPAASLTPTPDPEGQARAAALFQAIRTVLAGQIALPEAEVFAQLDAGVPLAQIVTDNGGDIEVVIRDLTTIMRDLIMDSAARGEINRIQAALFSSQMGTFIRIAVNSDLNTLGERFGGATPDPAATRGSLTDLLTQLPPPDAPSALTSPPNPVSTVERGSGTPPTDAADETPSPTNTALPTQTPIPTETDAPTAAPTSSATPTPPAPTNTRTPPPTPTETPDRVATLFAELTLTPIASPPAGSTDGDATPLATGSGSPSAISTRDPFAAFCIASVDFNLRLRRAPSRDAETILVIPYTTVLELTAQNSDGAWFATTYDGQTGWVDGTFLTRAASCANLPNR